MESKILVSVCCITYNHEAYIRQAIESFESQKTNFAFEVLVHDDASTDHTADIVMEMAAQYDNIHPICQKENQYSQGVAVSASILYPKAKGKYIAICEGDDYWTDPLKLQKQVDYMESHPDCGMCFHDAVVVNCSGKCLLKSFFPKNEFFAKYYKQGSCKYSAGEIMLLDTAPTNSLLFRTEDALNLPDYYFNNIKICGDLSYRLYFATKSYAYYMDEVMSAYRRGVSNSASQKANTNIQAKMKTLNGHLKILDEFDAETEYKYHNEVTETKRLKIFCHYFTEGALHTCRSQEFRDIFMSVSFWKRFKFYIDLVMPKTYEAIKRMRGIKSINTQK